MSHDEQHRNLKEYSVVVRNQCPVQHRVYAQHWEDSVLHALLFHFGLSHEHEQKCQLYLHGNYIHSSISALRWLRIGELNPKQQQNHVRTRQLQGSYKSVFHILLFVNCVLYTHHISKTYNKYTHTQIHTYGYTHMCTCLCGCVYLCARFAHHCTALYHFQKQWGKGHIEIARKWGCCGENIISQW